MWRNKKKPYEIRLREHVEYNSCSILCFSNIYHSLSHAHTLAHKHALSLSLSLSLYLSLSLSLALIDTPSSVCLSVSTYFFLLSLSLPAGCQSAWFDRCSFIYVERLLSALFFFHIYVCMYICMYIKLGNLKIIFQVFQQRFELLHSHTWIREMYIFIPVRKTFIISIYIEHRNLETQKTLTTS